MSEIISIWFNDVVAFTLATVIPVLAMFIWIGYVFLKDEKRM